MCEKTSQIIFQCEAYYLYYWRNGCEFQKILKVLMQVEVCLWQTINNLWDTQIEIYLQTFLQASTFFRSASLLFTIKFVHSTLLCHETSYVVIPFTSSHEISQNTPRGDFTTSIISWVSGPRLNRPSTIVHHWQGKVQSGD